MEDPAQKIVEKIKKEHIVPDSRFRLAWKGYLFWTVWMAMIFWGALFFSFIILNFLDIRPEIFHFFGLGKIFFLMIMTAPYLWIALSVLALFSGFLAIRQTQKGYRYSILFITSLSVLIISLLGIVLHWTKINQRMERGMFRGAPIGREWVFPIEKRWSRPNENMLGGEIKEIKEGGFLLIDFGDKIWEVECNQDTQIKVDSDLKPGMRIGVIGKVIEDGKFRAEFVHLLPLRENDRGEERERHSDFSPKPMRGEPMPNEGDF